MNYDHDSYDMMVLNNLKSDRFNLINENASTMICLRNGSITNRYAAYEQKLSSEGSTNGDPIMGH